MNNIPVFGDNVYKITLTMGILIVVYYFSIKFETKKENELRIKVSNEQFYKSRRELNLLDLNSKNQLLYYQDFLTKKGVIVGFKDFVGYPVNKIDSSQHRLLDSINVRADLLKKDFNELFATKSADSIENDLLIKEISQNENQYFKFNGIDLLLYFGVTLIVLSGTVLLKVNKEQINVFVNEAKRNGNYHDICQSCGRKFSSIRLKGKNSDGSQNGNFCLSCYDNGQFIEFNTIDDLVKKINSSKISSWRKRIIIKRIKLLERWKKDDY